MELKTAREELSKKQTEDTAVFKDYEARIDSLKGERDSLENQLNGFKEKLETSQPLARGT